MSDKVVSTDTGRDSVEPGRNLENSNELLCVKVNTCGALVGAL